jgi:hypothetical protein
MARNIGGFDPYKEDKEKELAKKGEFKKAQFQQLKRIRASLDADPLKRVFASQKAGQTSKSNNKSVKITLPTLKFLEKKNP